VFKGTNKGAKKGFFVHNKNSSESKIIKKS